mgnify:CR=1 FL=1
MNVLTLDGKEYILRADINVFEYIYKTYGSLDKFEKKLDITVIKDIAAVMINEHFAFIGTPERVTENFVGARIMPRDFEGVAKTVLAELIDSIKSKN